MKRPFVALLVVFLLGGWALYAEQSVLIDFSKLAADVTLGKASAPNENKATIIDFSAIAGASFTDEEKASMKTSLAPGNWTVTLASSSRTVVNQSLSMTKEAPVSTQAKPFNGQEIAGKRVLGIRIHFPVQAYNSWARIDPPFEIPAYADKTDLQGDRLVTPDSEKGKAAKFESYGVVKNVGVLKSLSLTVYGSNFPNGIGVVLADSDNNEQVIFLDYLQFDGWRTLTWNNPNYITDVRNRELKIYPLYPHSTPFVRLAGLLVYRDSQQEGGDFVTYVKDVTITYDKALLQPVRDIDDEALWNIITQRNEARRLLELKKLGTMQVQRYLERLKMDVSTPAPQ
jgi:hypothetical protein